MTLGSTIIWGAIILFLLVVIMFPEFRKQLKTLCGGFLGVFIEDQAKTPEGANAIYQQAIEEKQEDYNEASDILRKLSGQLTTTKRSLDEAKEKLAKVSKECENLVSSGDIENAKIKAEQRETVLFDIKRYEKIVNELTPRVADAQELYTRTGKDLETLKRDRIAVVENLKLNKQLLSTYDNLDKLKHNTTTSKLLESVRTGSEDSDQNVAGAKAIHENCIDTKIERAEQAAAKVSTNDYLEELKKKYNK
jgi:archaellum component FlaC